jgi:hypothetical protein
MTDSRRVLDQVAERLAARGYESLSNLQYIPHLEEVKDEDGSTLTIRAEARLEGNSLIIPIELWRGRDVCWIHLFVEPEGNVRIDRELCTNPIARR